MTRASRDAAIADTAFSLQPQASPEPTSFASLVAARTDILAEPLSLGDYNHTQHNASNASASRPASSRAPAYIVNPLPLLLSGSGRDGQLEDMFILCVLVGFVICMGCLCTYAVILLQRERERQSIEQKRQRAFADRSSLDPTTRMRPTVGGAGLTGELAAPTRAMLDDIGEMEARAASQRAAIREPESFDPESSPDIFWQDAARAAKAARQATTRSASKHPP